MEKLAFLDELTREDTIGRLPVTVVRADLLWYHIPLDLFAGDGVDSPDLSDFLSVVDGLLRGRRFVFDDLLLVDHLQPLSKNGFIPNDILNIVCTSLTIALPVEELKSLSE